MLTPIKKKPWEGLNMGEKSKLLTFQQDGSEVRENNSPKKQMVK